MYQPLYPGSTLPPCKQGLGNISDVSRSSIANKAEWYCGKIIQDQLVKVEIAQNWVSERHVNS